MDKVIDWIDVRPHLIASAMLVGCLLVPTTLAVKGYHNFRENTAVVNEFVDTYTKIPIDTVEVKGMGKGGEYTQGFRIEFDNFYAITDGQGLYGQKGMNLRGPGLVNKPRVNSFRDVADLCEKIEDSEEITISGRYLERRNGEKILFDGKKVLILDNALYNGEKMEIKSK